LKNIELHQGIEKVLIEQNKELIEEIKAKKVLIIVLWKTD